MGLRPDDLEQQEDFYRIKVAALGRHGPETDPKIIRKPGRKDEETRTQQAPYVPPYRRGRHGTQPEDSSAITESKPTAQTESTIQVHPVSTPLLDWGQSNGSSRLPQIRLNLRTPLLHSRQLMRETLRLQVYIYLPPSITHPLHPLPPSIIHPLHPLHSPQPQFPSPYLTHPVPAPPPQQPSPPLP